MTSRLRSILSFPRAYILLQDMLGARAGRQEFVNRYVRAKDGDRILDIGCGTADIVDCLPEVDYSGFDSSMEYIKAARKRYEKRGTFRCENVSTETLDGIPSFDIVLAMGILHHLSDEEAVKLLRLAKSALKEGGRFVTIDPCIVEGQSGIARFLISLDRGQCVRNKEGYERLVTPIFEQVRIEIRHNISRVPYTHIITECG